MTSLSQEFTLIHDHIDAAVIEALRCFGPNVRPDMVFLGREQQYAVFLAYQMRLGFADQQSFEEFHRKLLEEKIQWNTAAGLVTLAPTQLKDCCEITFKRIKGTRNELECGREVDQRAQIGEVPASPA